MSAGKLFWYLGFIIASIAITLGTLAAVSDLTNPDGAERPMVFFTFSLAMGIASMVASHGAPKG